MIILLGTIPFALAAYQHHHLFDAFAAFPYSFCTLGIFYSIQRIFDKINFLTKTIVLSLVLLVVNFFANYMAYPHVLLPPCLTYIIFIIGSNLEALSKTTIQRLHLKQKAFINLMCWLGLLTIYFMLGSNYLSEFTNHSLHIIAYPLCAILVSYILPKYINYILKLKQDM